MDQIDLEDELWEEIVKVRDAYPRLKNDAPTDAVVEAVMAVLAGRGLVVDRLSYLR